LSISAKQKLYNSLESYIDYCILSFSLV